MKSATPIYPAELRAQLHLRVPIEAKDRAKALGARWDRLARAWYVPHGLDIHTFAEWWPADLAAQWKALQKDLKSASNKGKARRTKRNRKNGGAA